MRDAAATIPISDVGLRKVCLRCGVPVPVKGYWSKLRAGHRVRKISLPPTVEGQSEEVVIFAPAPLHGAALEARTRALAAAANLPAAVIVPSTVHKHVAALKRALVGRVPDKRGALTLVGGGESIFSVSPANVERALSLLSNFSHAADALGYSISFGEGQPTELVIKGQRMPFFLREKYTRTERKISEAERRALSPTDRRYYNAIGWKKDWIFTATGKLQINFGGTYGHGLRQLWSDRPGASLESQIEKVLGEAAAMAAYLREEERRHTSRMAEQREGELRRLEELRLEKLEDQREEFFSEKAQQFEEAIRLEAFLSQLRRDASPSPKLAAFFAWADEHVESLRDGVSAQAIDEELKESELFA
jgi:hypothetical protein